MALTDTIAPVTGIEDPAQARVLLYQAGRPVHAPLDSVGLATDTEMASAIDAAIDGLATAEARSRLVNGAMLVSQENGDTASAVATTGGWYSADQWHVSWGLTGTASSARTRPSNSGSDVVAITIGTATSSPAAGAYLQIQQAIEGTRVRDFLWGTANAKQVVFRFDLYATVAGTFTVQIKNAAGNRTFLAPFTTLASTWQTHTVVVPGDTTGTWPTTTAKGMDIGFGFAAGTTYGGGVAGWQSGNKVTMVGSTNGAATAGATFLIADVGLYLDPQATGLPPAWTMPDEAEELQACQRYWSRQALSFFASVTNAVGYWGTLTTAVPTRIAPVLTGVNVAASGFPSATGTLDVLGALPNYYIREQRTANATGAAGFFLTTVTLNSRM